MASSPITSWQIDGETMNIVHTIFLGSKITAYGDCSHAIRRHLPFGRKATKNLDSHIQMWELVHKEDWTLKNWCFRSVVLEKTLESPLDCKEIKPVHPKRNQSWIFFGRTDAEAKALILCPPDVKSWLIGKDPDAGNDWGQEEKGVTEDEMVAWHHQLNGHEFEQTPGDNEGQGTLASCSPWDCKNLTRLTNRTTTASISL